MINAATFWDKTAPGYAKRPIAEPDAYERTMQRTLDHISPQDHVLELGCGTGGTALRMATKAAHVTGSDISPAMIAFGEAAVKEQGVQNVRFVAADLRSAELADRYDIVAAFNLMHLVEDVDGALADIRGRLAPGGLFISKTPTKPTSMLSPIFWLLRVALPVLQLLGKAPFVRMSPLAEWEAAIMRAGFEIIESDTHNKNFPSRFVVARAV